MDGVGCVTDLDNLKATELRLGLPGSETPGKPTPPTTSRATKRSLDDDGQAQRHCSEGGQQATKVTKAQVVGWPPIRSYRKNSFQAMKTEATEAAGLYVKVSMDGAPYLRKIDLKVYKGYTDLREGLEEMFKCFEGCKGSEYAITYEDKDGDLMLVGDVPWEMFTSFCKKLRIIRGAESIRDLGSNH